jgi:hypothetical protein
LVLEPADKVFDYLMYRLEYSPSVDRVKYHWMAAGATAP